MADEKSLNDQFAEALRHVPVYRTAGYGTRNLIVEREVPVRTGRIDIKVGRVVIECAWQRNGDDGAIADAKKRDPFDGNEGYIPNVRYAVWYEPNTRSVTADTVINWLCLGSYDEDGDGSDQRGTVKKFAEEIARWE